MNTKIPLYKDSRLYTFLGVIAFLFFHHFYGYFGHYGFDDIMGYGYYAKKWADGNLFFLNEDFFSFRWGFIALTGFCYALFGMSDEVSAIVPSLVLLSTVLLIFRVLKANTRTVALVGALIYSLDNWTIYYSDKLMPDTLVALCVFAAFAIIHNFRYVRNGEASLKHAFSLSLVLIFAYVSKQSVLLLFPVFFILLILDFLQKRHVKFWLQTAAFCILMGLLYLIVIYLLTGDPLARFHAVEQGLNDNLGSGRSFSFCNYAIQPWSVLLYRIGYEMIYKFMATGMMFSLMLAFAAIFTIRVKELLICKSAETYWGLVFLLSLLSSNFMTTSYKAYLPICPDIRHFLFLVPLAAVVAAPFLCSFAEKVKHRGVLLLVSVIVLGLSFYAELGNMKWLYLLLFFLLLLRSFLTDHPLIKWGFLSGVFSIALLPVISSMNTANENAYIEQREVIYKYLKNNSDKSIVFTNVVQSHFGKYYLEFEKDASTQFFSYSAIPSFGFSKDSVYYVLVNGYTRYMSNFDYNELPRCIKDCYEGNKPLSIDEIYKTEKVALYKLNRPRLLKENTLSQ